MKISVKTFRLNDVVITPFGVGIVQGTLTKDGEVKILVSHEGSLPDDKRQPSFLHAYPQELLTRLSRGE